MRPCYLASVLEELASYSKPSVVHTNTHTYLIFHCYNKRPDPTIQSLCSITTPRPQFITSTSSVPFFISPFIYSSYLEEEVEQNSH